MKINNILITLENEGYMFQYIGSRDCEIYGVKILPCTLIFKESNILCVTSDNSILKENIKYNSILVLKGNQKLKFVVNRINQIIYKNIKRKDFMFKLYNGICKATELKKLVYYCSIIMQNQVLFINEDMNICYQYPIGTISDDYIKCLKDGVKILNEGYITAYVSNPLKCLMRKIFHNGKKYYIFIVEKENVINSLVDKEYLDNICTAFNSIQVQKKERNINTVITELIKYKCKNKDKILTELFELGWEDFDKYYILTIKKVKGSESNKIYNDLKLIVHTNIYEVDDYYIIILHSEKYLEYTEQNFKNLNTYLKENEIIAFLSMGFFDITDCNLRFMQCVRCIERCKKRKEKGLRYYARYQMTDMINTLNSKRIIDLKAFCSPIILQIYEYDKKYSKEYLSTLFSYICSGQSIKQTALAMNIHVNTIYMRVNKLREIFKINFNDLHLMYTLHNSIILILMDDENCINESYPYLEL